MAMGQRKAALFFFFGGGTVFWGMRLPEDRQEICQSLVECRVYVDLQNAGKLSELPCGLVPLSYTAGPSDKQGMTKPWQFRKGISGSMWIQGEVCGFEGCLICNIMQLPRERRHAHNTIALQGHVQHRW